jgi:hypothetical protein
MSGHRWWLFALIVATLWPVREVVAQPDPIKPPFAPWSVNLPELGRMRGAISTRQRKGDGEEFAKEFSGVGDVNNDGLNDWVVSRVRCDSIIPISRRNPREVLLYLGQRGLVPPVEAGVRIGSTEFETKSDFLAAGDFDGDRNRDLVLSVERLLDSSGYNTQSVIVFWGDGTGRYSTNDTTWLPCETQLWIALVQAIAHDFNDDGADDLLVYGLVGFREGNPVKIPTLRIFAGANGSRWRRQGDRPREPAWLKWNAWSVTQGRLAVLDQNCDGRADLVFYYDNNSGPSRVTICYGGPSGFPDTSDFETLEPTVANGRSALFSDVTGDGSPELLLNCGNHQSVKIFAGRPGQRLLEQYGSGLDAPTAGKGWWSRPWAEIWTPSRLKESWSLSGYDGFLELGDVSTDGIDEIWIYSDPYIMGYRTLDRMDSLADVWLRYNGVITHAARLGDIDGSGRVTVAVSYDFYPHDLNFPFPGEMIFLQSTPEVTGLAWIHPHRVMPHLAGERCGEAPSAASDDASISATQLRLVVSPNPSADDIVLDLTGAMESDELPRFEIHDAVGALVLSGTLSAKTRNVLSTVNLAPGIYWVSVTADGRTARTQLRLR